MLVHVLPQFQQSPVTGEPAQRTGMGAGVVVGLLALGEGMPSTLGLQALRLLSWLCITGVSTLAGGRGVSMPASCPHVLPACLPGSPRSISRVVCRCPVCITAGVSMLAGGKVRISHPSGNCWLC